MEINEREIAKQIRKAVKGIRISKKKRSVFLKDFKPSELPEDVQDGLRTLAVEFKYRVWTQLKLF